MWVFPVGKRKEDDAKSQRIVRVRLLSVKWFCSHIDTQYHSDGPEDAWKLKDDALRWTLADQTWSTLPFRHGGPYFTWKENTHSGLFREPIWYAQCFKTTQIASSLRAKRATLIFWKTFGETFLPLIISCKFLVILGIYSIKESPRIWKNF